MRLMKKPTLALCALMWIFALTVASPWTAASTAHHRIKQDMGSDQHFTVTGKVVGDCQIDGGSPGTLSFSYDPITNTALNISVQSHIEYYCTSGAPVTLSVQGNPGTPFGADLGANTLNYNLYYKAIGMACGAGQPAGSTAMTQSTLYPLQPGDGNDQGVNFCASPVTSPAQPLIPVGPTPITSTLRSLPANHHEYATDLL